MFLFFSFPSGAKINIHQIEDIEEEIEAPSALLMADERDARFEDSSRIKIFPGAARRIIELTHLRASNVQDNTDSILAPSFPERIPPQNLNLRPLLRFTLSAVRNLFA